MSNTVTKRVKKVKIIIDDDSDYEEDTTYEIDKMNSMNTALKMSVESLKYHDYSRYADEIDNDTIKVGDYVYGKMYGYKNSAIGQVCRRTSKTIWINKIKTNGTNKVRVTSGIGAYGRWFESIFYWNINESKHLDTSETRMNGTLRKISSNFTTSC